MQPLFYLLLILALFAIRPACQSQAIVAVDPTFSPGSGIDGRVNCFALQPDGKILCGGIFFNYQGIPRNGIARLHADGSLDTTFHQRNWGFGGDVHAMALQPDGKVICIGRFAHYDRVPRRNIARLNADGSLDTTFHVRSGFGGHNLSEVYALALQPNGKVVCAGDFYDYDGIPCQAIARLNPDGSLDTAFNQNPLSQGIASRSVSALALQPDGRIICGGTFSYGSPTRYRIARLLATGSPDTTFHIGTGFDYGVSAITLQADGKLLCEGKFSRYNNTACPRLVRLGPDGTLDTSFTPPVLNVEAWPGEERFRLLALQPDGRILAGGIFDSVNHRHQSKLLRLNADGSLDTTFIIGTGFDNGFDAMALQPDGKLLCNGPFFDFNGIGCNRFLRLLIPDVVATKSATPRPALHLSPNPTRHTLTLTTPEPLQALHLIHASGKSTVLHPTPALTQNLDTAHLPPGLYLLQAKGQASNRPYTARLLIR